LLASSPNAIAARHWGPWLALLLILAGTSTVRLRLLSLPLERDEGEYAYAGQLLLRGIPLYQRLYNMKWPGTYYAYAAIEGVLGQTIHGIRLGLLLVNGAQIVLVFLIARRLFDAWSAVAAAAAFAVFSLSPSTLAFAGHATHFVVLAALGALFCMQRAMERQSTALYFVTGFFAALAPVMKQPGIVFTLFVMLFCAWSEMRARRIGWSSLKRGGAFLAGLAIPWLAVLASLLMTGTLRPFWLWTVTYAQNYGTPVSWGELPGAFLSGAFEAMGYECFLALVAVAGLVALFFDARTRAAGPFLIGLFLFSLAGVFPGTVFRPHYFLLVLPASALLAAAAVCVVSRRLESVLPQRGIGIAACLVALPALFAIWEQREFYFTMTPDAACRFVYPVNPFVESLQAAAYLQERTGPEDTIAVLGSEPQIYFYSRRLSATGYVYAYPLVENQPYAHAFQLQMIHEIEAAKPKFIVFVKVANSWLASPNADPTLMKWFAGYKQQNLKSVEAIPTAAKGSLQIYEATTTREQAAHTTNRTAF
jgi:4-amino-4-deoxy-L-arabinose transferase-like glycosyltransferase